MAVIGVVVDDLSPRAVAISGDVAVELVSVVMVLDSLPGPSQAPGLS